MHDPAHAAHVVAAHLGQPARRAQLAARRLDRLRSGRSCASGGPAPGRSSSAAAAAALTAPLREGSSSLPVTIAPAPIRRTSGSSWPGSSRPCVDQPVDGPEQVGPVRVAVRGLVAHRHRPVGHARQDRVGGAAPGVVGEDLAGQNQRARVVRPAAVEVPADVGPGARDALPGELLLDRGAAHERQGGERDQRRQANRGGDQRHAPHPRARQGDQARPGQLRSQAEQAGHPDRHQRGRLLRGAHEAHQRDVAVDPLHRLAAGRAGRERGQLDRHADQQHEQQERRVAPAPRPDEAAEREGGQQHRGAHGQRVEQQRARLAEQRPVDAVEAHADVRRPVAPSAAAPRARCSCPRSSAAAR